MNWFTSDHHFNHENIRGYCNRPFSSTEEMNEAMISRWNSCVLDSDTVYHIGDMFLGRPENAIEIVKRLKGHKILIAGNHDRSSKTMLECGFDEVYKKMDFTFKNGKRALLRHKPLPESLLISYDFQIHGHAHSGEVVNGKRLNVCVDLWGFQPISEDEICDIKFQPQSLDLIEISNDGNLIQITATIRKEDMDGFADHLSEYTRKLSYTQDS